MLFRVGISYYDSLTRELHVPELWEDDTVEFPLIDLVKDYFACPVTHNI